MASMYAVYHGPDGLRRIARSIHRKTALLARHASAPKTEAFFDTITVEHRAGVIEKAAAANINLRDFGDGKRRHLPRRDDHRGGLCRPCSRFFGADSADIWRPTSSALPEEPPARERVPHPPGLQQLPHRDRDDALPAPARRPRPRAQPQHDPARFLHDEAQRRRRDDAGHLAEVADIHPFAPADQARATRRCCRARAWLAEITGFHAVSLQPNAGSQGEYAGLLAIRRYHESRGDTGRNICLIPTSAHGTNPASAVMAGFKVVRELRRPGQHRRRRHPGEGCRSTRDSSGR